VHVYGQATIARFARKHAASRKPLQRFTDMVKQASWRHFADGKSTFGSADYAAGRLVFDVGGNKYRVIASVDFDEQILVVYRVMTHEDYDREKL
jgi:mRNA interferase HigB